MLGSAFGYRHLSGALAFAAGHRRAGARLPARARASLPGRARDVLAAYRWLIDRGAEPEQRGPCHGGSAGRPLGGEPQPRQPAVAAVLAALRAVDLPDPLEEHERELG